MTLSDPEARRQSERSGFETNAGLDVLRYDFLRSVAFETNSPKGIDGFHNPAVDSRARTAFHAATSNSGDRGGPSVTRKRDRRPPAVAAGLLTSVLLLAASVTPAGAWTAYYIAEEKTWVIFCKDRTVWGYAGSEEGLEVVGPALCEDHGGVAGGGHGKPRVLPAPRDLRAVVEGGCTPGPMPGTRRCKAPRGISRITISEEDKHK